MPTSSTGAVYSSSNAGEEPQATSDDCNRPAALAGIPDNSTLAIDRFLNNRSSSFPEIVAEDQRPPIEFREAQDEAGIETRARVHMLAKLHAFDKKFASSGDKAS